MFDMSLLAAMLSWQKKTPVCLCVYIIVDLPLMARFIITLYYNGS